MKKRRILRLIVAFGIVFGTFSSMLHPSALAGEEVCICTQQCSEESANADCPVCRQDYARCLGKAADNGCAHLGGCSAGEHDEACPLYAGRPALLNAPVQAGSFERLKQAVAGAVAGQQTVIQITADIQLSETLTVASGRDIVITDDGRQRTLTRAGAAQPVFSVAAGGSLTLTATAEGNLIITEDRAGGQLLNSGRIIYCNGHFVLDGAVIKNISSLGTNTGVVYVSGRGSVFDMKSGEISGCRMDRSALSSTNATVHIADGAVMNISGGKITGNTALGAEMQRTVTAGVLANAEKASVRINMTGGEISANVSTVEGDGGGGILLSGSAGGADKRAYLYMNGGKITGNECDYAGGGVFVRGNAEFIMDNGEISGNIVKDGMGGGVATTDYVVSRCEFYISFCADNGLSLSDLYSIFGVSTKEDLYEALIKNATGYGILDKNYNSFEEAWEDYPGTFEMNGGTISGNKAQRAGALYGDGDGGCGGGIYVASNNVSLKGGQITDNTARRQGGGVYVGSVPYVLYMYDTLVTANAADIIGGGIWLCPTGTATSYVENGGAVYDNTAGGAGDDVASVAKSANARLSLTNRLLGNWLVHWYEDGRILPNSGVLGNADPDADRYPGTTKLGGVIDSTDNLALKAVAADEGKAEAVKNAKLLISRNSAPRGGGIGTNGTVVFNKYYVDYPKVDVSITKVWNTTASHPASVTVHLLQNGVRIDTVTLNRSNNWSARFTDLPKYQGNALEIDPDKKLCVYTFEEDAVTGYTRTIEKDKDNQYSFTLTNTPVGALRVHKTVTGDGAETDRAFEFTVQLSDTGINGVYGDMTFTSGKAVFTLKHGQTATALNLPRGTGYTVSEKACDGYTASSTNESGTIEANKTTAAEFVNTRSGGNPPPPPPPPKTGDNRHNGMWIVINMVSAAGLAGTVVFCKAKKF